MPRARSRKFCCGCAESDPLEKAKVARAKAKARRDAMTPEEKERKKEEAAERAVLRKKKKEWEESLKEWISGDSHRGDSFPNGTKVR